MDAIGINPLLGLILKENKRLLALCLHELGKVMHAIMPFADHDIVCLPRRHDVFDC
jgi:hypothetical protein